MVARKVTPEGERYGSFFSRYVEPEFRRLGIASRLLAEALAWFEPYDGAFLLAQTHVTNEPLRLLFERHGFRVVGRSEHPWPHFTLRRDRVPMQS